MPLCSKFLQRHTHTRKALEQRIASLVQSSTCHTQLLQLHAFYIKSCLCRNNFLQGKLLSTLLSLSSPHHLPYARSMFDSFFLPDTFIWNTMMRAYLNAQNPQQSLALYFQMRLHHHLLLDSFSLSLVLQACARLMDSENGLKLHAHVLKLGFSPDLYVQTALIEMYAKCGCVEYAVKVLDYMREPDLVSYNVLLSEFVRMGEFAMAHDLFDRMPERDLVSWNTIIHGYTSLGDIGASKKSFDIATSEQRRQSTEALKLFHDMQLANVVPDKITMISVLNACGNVGALGMGKMIHEYVERNGIGIDMKLGTSLLDMYAKCGDIDSSLRMFERMNQKDIFTWSVMIMGLANHGFGDLALEYFTKMVSQGITPNEVTFIGVLCACSHIGLVERGWVYFKSMSSVYGVTPKIEHYGCMVDTLGRAGRLQEAMELIRTMPFAPDAIVWRAFLGACRIHKNVELAEEATVSLLELEPHADGNYVLMSNMYSQAMKWDKVVNLRRMMKNANIQKVPGCSSIEVDNSVYEFVSGDKSHPKSSQIYEMLDEILYRLQNAGYEPVTTSTTQYIDEQEKQNALAIHSEKLAIAFGILATAPGTPIRIFKNLRVCEDCHLAIKFIAKEYHRKIIVRDRNRFHHFEEGSCSCKDYW
ncbi:pentatricopeptide repeat-containing protein [Senna tora]|uniref:Pentatricopeptide repeat-containing protein n=1 Tax=Senna tora TaxID=362788 RepID=A0A834SJT3_9FABA|nr:pentatricopeptide repeat-containing protein [Senna tora]